MLRPCGGYSTTLHRSELLYDSYICLMPWRSKVQQYPKPEGCMDKFVATQEATSNETPSLMRSFTRTLGDLMGRGNLRSLSIRSPGWSLQSGSCSTSPGTVSRTQTCTGLGRALEPNWSTIFITTFPPNEWPISILGKRLSFLRRRSTSSEAPSTEFTASDVRPATAVPPWHLRSTRTNCQAGFSLASFLANPRRFLPEPRIPCTSTAVGTSTLELSLNATSGPFSTSYLM
mmetsp:Transcript_5098/g.15321  ORF Transcript_5098/g.15321 Transcript_5098/m.15321 type:complete len:231 (-) Transcript_5098:518-1210(-)